MVAVQVLPRQGIDQTTYILSKTSPTRSTAAFERNEGLMESVNYVNVKLAVKHQIQILLMVQIRLNTWDV